MVHGGKGGSPHPALPPLGWERGGGSLGQRQCLMRIYDQHKRRWAFVIVWQTNRTTHASQSRAKARGAERSGWELDSAPDPLSFCVRFLSRIGYIHAFVSAERRATRQTSSAPAVAVVVIATTVKAPAAAANQAVYMTFCRTIGSLFRRPGERTAESAV